MFKFIILSLAAIPLLTAAASIGSGEVQDFEFPQLNDTESEQATSRFSLFMASNKMYALVTFAKVNWFAAQQICSYNGMTLASINSPAEQNQLQQYLLENGLLYSNYGFWLSGNDLADEGNWFWLSTGRPLIFSNWFPNEPNDFNGDEDCMVMYSNGQWNDENCLSERYCICENRCPLNSYEVPLFP